MAVYRTLSDVYADVRYAASKDSTTLPDATLLRLANKYYYLLFRELVDLHEDFYAEISTSNLIANQQEYVLPLDDTDGGGGLIKILRVETSYDGSNWRVAEGTTQNEILTPLGNQTDINQNFYAYTPKYYFFDRSLFLLPIPTSNVTAGIKIFWIRRPTEMDSTLDVPDLPKTWLSLLVEGMKIDIFQRFSRPQDMHTARKNWDEGIAKMKKLEQQPDLDTRIQFKTFPKRYD